jgi:hypothetical protein
VRQSHVLQFMDNPGPSRGRAEKPESKREQQQTEQQKRQPSNAGDSDEATVEDL